mgnify:CR=1 FL=1
MSKSEEKLDPRVKRTRKLLHNAFIELVSEKGFTATSVQDIADRAEINRATFYAHYTDKFELHDEMMIHWFRHHLEQYEVNTESNFCGDNLRNLIYAVCDFQGQLNGGCHPADLQYKPDIEALIQNEIYSIVYGWMQSLEGITNPDISATAISWSIFGAGLRWSRQQKHSKEEVAETIIAMVRDGLKSQVKEMPELVTA